MKKILIVGGGGYIGTSLTNKLLKSNIVKIYDEFNFDWILKNHKQLKNNNRLFFIKKKLNEVSLGDFKEIDIVCDVCGISNDPSGELNSKFTWDVNYKGRIKFASMAKKAGVKHYIFNSTCAVYGHNKRIVSEKSKKNPISTYAKANLKAEEKIYSMRNKNFTVNVLRNATLYGSSHTMRLDLVINKFVYDFMKTKKITIHGDGQQWRPFVSIADICNIYFELINKKRKSFICNAVSFNLKINELAKLVSFLLKGKKNSIIYKANNFDLRNYKVSNTKFLKEFENFKFSDLKKEIIKLKSHFNKYKTKENEKTIRMLYYKKKLSLK